MVCLKLAVNFLLPLLVLSTGFASRSFFPEAFKDESNHVAFPLFPCFPS